MLKAENEQRSRRLRIEEQSRLTARLRGAQSTEEARRLLGQIVVVGTYVKRRSNLVFLSSRMTQLPVCELRLCLNESAENLRLYGAELKALRYLVRGMSYGRIAEAMGIEVTTVKYHVTNMFQKSNFDNKLQLTVSSAKLIADLADD